MDRITMLKKQAQEKSWKRAHTLAKAASTKELTITAMQSRGYLSTQPEEEKATFDKEPTSKTKHKWQTHIKNVQNWAKSGKTNAGNPKSKRRPSAGDPNRPVRGGASTPTTRPKITKNPTTDPYTLLIDLKHLALKHGGTQNILKGAETLAKICD